MTIDSESLGESGKEKMREKKKLRRNYNAWTMIVVSSIQGVSMSSVIICEIFMRSSPPSA